VTHLLIHRVSYPYTNTLILSPRFFFPSSHPNISSNTHISNLNRLSQPLHPEAAALVRQIYRRCYLLRAHFILPPPAAAAEEGDEEGMEDEEEGPVAVLARLNTLIAITGTFFEQAEGGQEEEEEEEGEEGEDVMVVEEAEEEQEEVEQQQHQQQREEGVERKREEGEEGEKGGQAEEEEKEEGEVEEEGEIL